MLSKFPKSSTQRATRCFSVRTTVPAERNWDPKEIYPVEKGQVRICGNTLRDGHQSLNGGLHRIDLLVQGAELLDKIRPADMKFPGNEEIGGGTVVDFPLRFKGENPFRNMEMIASKMPNTPTSALIRSDSLCGYTINPRDVVRAFIKRYAECGIDIFRNFDAYNNVRNHATVAQAVLDAGKHYQAAITFTSHPDPTLYNVKWVADLAKAFRDLGAHSIAVKDMAGIASPALAKAWVSEIKNAVPELPCVVHSHYTTGFSPITYMQVIEAGANGIDLAVSSLSGRSGHPCMEVFIKVLSDMGYDLGFDVDAAQAQIKEVANLYRVYHPFYEFCEMKMAGTVDYRVFEKGIPGGQISIFRNELIRNDLGHLFDDVMAQIQTVRQQAGGVALVTPTAEHVARQATVNAQQGLTQTTMESRLWMGYSEMLRGVMGRPLEKMDETIQKRCLLEWTEDQLKAMELSDDVKEEIKPDLAELVDVMWVRAQPILKKQRMDDLKDRIRHLTDIDASKFADRIKECEAELSELTAVTPSDISDVEKVYASFLAMDPAEQDFNQLMGSFDARSFAVNMKRGTLSKDQFYELVRAAAFCTITPSSVMPDGLEMRKDEIEQLAWEYDFELPPRDSVEFKEWAILQSMFSKSQNIALNFFRFHQAKPEFWAENPYTPQANADRLARAPPAHVEPVMYPFISKSVESVSRVQDFSDVEVERVLGHDIKKLTGLRQKLDTLKKLIPETEMRAKLRDRSVENISKEIASQESSMLEKMNAILANTTIEGSNVKVLHQESLDKLMQQSGLSAN